ncbi:ArsR/SmtB family transcription factor [Colwelliaceae bacterium 6441]
MEPNIVEIAGLIGEATRARMLTALMAGKALTATELAVEADISSSTASSHLTKLVNGNLLVVRKQGRHKYFQLKGVEVAELLEKLLTISASNKTPTTTGPSDPALRKSRICYDHLAGEFGVTLYDALVGQNLLIDNGSETSLTAKGRLFFQSLGVDFDTLSKSKRPLCKSCLDWSERRNHLAGELGQWMLNDIMKKGWATKQLDSRIIQFTPQGLKRFYQQYDIALA